MGRSGRSGNAGEEDDVTPLTAAELTSRLAEYSAFRNNVLAADLARLQLRQARLQVRMRKRERGWEWAGWGGREGWVWVFLEGAGEGGSSPPVGHFSYEARHAH